jgi:HEAT repeat protein
MDQLRRTLRPRRASPLPHRAFLLAFLLLGAGAGARAAEPAKLTILGKDAEGWLLHLKTHETPPERRLAVYCLGEFGPEGRLAAPALTKLIHDPLDAEVRRLAVEALGLIGPDARPALGELLKTIEDRQEAAPALRRSACQAVARIAPETPEVEKAVLKAMREEDPALRQAAIDAAVTVAVFSRGKEVLPALSRALREPQDAEAAATALRCMGQPGVAPLAEALAKGSEARVRLVAAQALGRLGEAARPVLEALRRAASRDKDTKVREACFAALADLAATDPESLEVFADGLGVKELTGAAERALRKAGPGGFAVLRKALKARRAEARAAAARVLGALGEAAAPLQGDLADALEDKEDTVRAAAAEALGRLGPAAAGARDALLKLARATDNGNVQYAAALAAANVGRAPGTPPHRSPLEVVPDEQVLKLLAHDRTAAVRAEAAAVLRLRTAQGAPLVEALTAALGDRDAAVRIAAAKSLAFFAAAAQPAASRLIPWLGSGDKELRHAALATLTAIGPASPEACDAILAFALSPATGGDVETRSLLGYALRAHAPATTLRLAAELKNPDAAVAVRAARGLETLGKLALPAREELYRALLSTNEELMTEAAAALGNLGPEAREYVPTLLKFLTYAASAWRMAGASALGSIGFDPARGDEEGLVQALLPILLDEEEDVAWAAYVALYVIGPPALPKVRELLKIAEGDMPFWALRVLARQKADPEEVVPRLILFAGPGMRAEERAVAAELLGQYAPERTEAIPALVRVLGDRTDYVVRAAARSLVSFGGAALPALSAALRGRDPEIRRQALAVLEELRGAAGGP